MTSHPKLVFPLLPYPVTLQTPPLPPKKSPGGRPSKLSDQDTRYALRLIGTGKADNAVQVTQSLQNIINQPLSAKTVHPHLSEAGIEAVVKRRRLFLSKHHRRERLDFAITHQDWTVEDWKTVVWSDETKINRLGSDGRKWVWKRAGEGFSDRLVQGTQKFGGGSLMVWGCMLWDGVGYACKIDGKMDGELYANILEDEFQASLAFFNENPRASSSSRTMTPSTRPKRPPLGLKTMNQGFYHGLHNLQTLIPLNNCGDTSRGSWREHEKAPAGILEL